MSKLVMIRLLSTAIIAGVPRSPVEGIQTVPEDDAKRLIAAGQAEDAEADVDRDEGGSTSDGLDRMNKAKLQELAKAEGVTIEGDANKATIIEAIRAKRADTSGNTGGASAPTALDGLDEAALREVAEKEGVPLEDGLDEAGIRSAIETARATV